MLSLLAESGAGLELLHYHEQHMAVIPWKRRVVSLGSWSKDFAIGNPFNTSSILLDWM